MSTNGVLRCQVPGCSITMVESLAFVPAIQAIRKATGKPVRPASLADHAVCEQHAKAGRREGVKMYPFATTVAELERRAEQREKEQSFFQVYSALEAARPWRSKAAKEKIA